MVHSMFFSNCVKEQCYKEEQNTRKHAHTPLNAHIHTHTHTHTHTHANTHTPKGAAATIGLDGKYDTKASVVSGGCPPLFAGLATGGG